MTEVLQAPHPAVLDAATGPVSVSVVIAWVNPLELISPCIEELLRQARKGLDELIVATRHGEQIQQRLSAHFPEITILSAPPHTPIPQLRSMGIRRASGTVIAVTEDHCVPGKDWIKSIAAHIQSGCAIVGGPVENQCTTRLRDWAAFLTEYAAIVRPATREVQNSLPGNNVAYRRELVQGLCGVLDQGLWESFYHEKLQRGGTALIFDRDLVVQHCRQFDFWYFVRQRYYFCRAFAAMRLNSLTPSSRWKFGLGSLALPLLLYARGLGNLVRRKRLVGCYLACSPLIVMYLVAGAVGESIGYFAGGGESLERVE